MEHPHVFLYMRLLGGCLVSCSFFFFLLCEHHRCSHKLLGYIYVCMHECMDAWCDAGVVGKCSLCTVSVQWSVAQSACVLRALSVHDRVSFSDKGR